MKNNNEPIPAGGMTLCALVFTFTILTRDAFTSNKGFPWLMCCFLPMLIIALKDIRENRPPVKFSLPDLSRLRYYIQSILHKGK